MITVPVDAYEKFLEPAARALSERAMVKGFRKGHVPYEMMRKEVGDMAILQEALADIVESSFLQAIREANVETIGSPSISIQKIAPGNDIVYGATVASLPDVKIIDLDKIKIEQKHTPVEESDILSAMETLRTLQATEVITSGKATGADKVIVDFSLFLDRVPVEGGQAKDFQVYLSEKQFIPGFNEHILGVQKGDEKKFSLAFPKEHYQKHLAGKMVDFEVKVKEVYERILPPVDDAFAKRLGQDNMEALKHILRKNLEEEARQKVEQQFEIEILDRLVAGSTFGELPDVLVDTERERIYQELLRDLEKHGIAVEAYLQDLKKTEEEMRIGFTLQAEKRVKAALLTRLIAKTEGIVATKEELEKEIEMLRKMYENNNEEYRSRLNRDDVRASIALVLQNKKVVQWLKDKIRT